jgi:hypothetical protein
MDYGVWISECSYETFRNFINVDSETLEADDMYINSPKYIYFNPFKDKQGRIGFFLDRLTNQTQLVYICYSWFSYCPDNYVQKVTNKIESITGNRVIFTNYRALAYKHNITREVFTDAVYDKFNSYASKNGLPLEMIDLIFKYY